jgi:hypothetical protein
MDDLFPVSVEDKIKCLEREMALRELLYPKWIKEGSISEKKAGRELLVMRAILNDYKKAADNAA